MSSFQALIDVYRMDELPRPVRADVIVELGLAINFEFGRNIAEAIVWHLVKDICPNHRVVTDEHYLRCAKVGEL